MESIQSDLTEINLEAFERLSVIHTNVKFESTIQVEHVRHISSQLNFALKVVTKPENPKELDYFLKEFVLVKGLDHPNIIKLYSYKETDKQIYVLYEFMERKLKKGYKTMGELQAALVVLQVAEGLEYLHSRRIIHRDVNLSNVMISGSGASIKAKLISFEYAGDLREQRITECGSLDSIAPEILNYEVQNQKVDTWGLGVIMYLLYAKTQPFLVQGSAEQSKQSEQLTILNIKTCTVKYPQCVGPEIRQILEKVLVSTPAFRLTLTQIIQKPYFKKYKQKLQESQEREYLQKKVADLEKELSSQKSRETKSKQIVYLQNKLGKLQQEFKQAQQVHDKQKLKLKETEIECMRLEKERRTMQEYRMNLQKSKLQLNKVNHNILLVVEENKKIKLKTERLEIELERLKKEETALESKKSSSSLSKYATVGSKEKPRSRNKSRQIPPLLNQSKSSRNLG